MFLFAAIYIVSAKIAYKSQKYKWPITMREPMRFTIALIEVSPSTVAGDWFYPAATFLPVAFVLAFPTSYLHCVETTRYIVLFNKKWKFQQLRERIIERSFHLAPVEKLDNIKMNYETNNGVTRPNKFAFDC